MTVDTPVTPEVTQPVEPETTSLSDHEQDFAPQGRHPVIEREEPATDEGERDDKGQFRGRHRANSQKAGPEDAKTIAEYTKRLREAEAQAGIERKPGESERVYQLRVRTELAEARRDALKAPKAIPAPPKPAVIPRPASTSTFSEPEPTLEQFGTSEDPYRDYMRALAAYDRKKEAFDARQASEKERTTQAQKQHDEQFNTWIKERDDEHVQRLDAFIKAHPEAIQKFEAAADLSLTPVMYAAAHLHPRGPELMLAYADNPDVVDELFLLTDGKPLGDPVTNPLVAIVQRRLLQRVQAAQTGSAASPRHTTVAPRPPNPVRTAPQTPSDALPDDESSLASHEKVWGSPRRRR